MSSRPKTYKRVRTSGMLDERRRYTKRGLLRAGIGPKALAAMRASGIVTPIDVGYQRWYRGAEVCRWIDSQQK